MQTLTNHTRRLPVQWVPLATAILVLLAFPGQGQTPLGTAFIYQGLLTDKGSPANGTYDLRFILYNAPEGGAQVGSILNLSDQWVGNGLFSAPLDFGAAAFAGEARWLEIGVRLGTSTGIFSVLSPRQELAVAPGAIFASKAAIATTAATATSADRAVTATTADTATTAESATTATIATTALSYSGKVLRIESNSDGDNPALEIKDNSPGQARLAAVNFLQTYDATRGQVAYQNPSGPMTFRVGNATAMALDNLGRAGIAGALRAGSTNVNAWNHIGSGGTPTVDDISNVNDLYVFGDIQTHGLIYTDWALVVGDPTPTANQTFTSFGSGMKEESAIAGVDDVYISGNLELDGALYTGSALNVPDGFVINVGGTMANLTIAGANAIIQIGDTTSDRVGIGRTPTTNALEVAGNASKAAAGSWLANSDRRLKQDIQDLPDALAVIDRLRPVKFRYAPEFFQKHPGTRDVWYYNYVAQEFRQVFPDSVQDDGEGYLQLDTHNAEVYAVAAIQELHRALKQRDAQIARLQERLDALQETLGNRLAALEDAVRVHKGPETARVDR